MTLPVTTVFVEHADTTIGIGPGSKVVGSSFGNFRNNEEMIFGAVFPSGGFSTLSLDV